jgi:ribosome-associated protein
MDIRKMQKVAVSALEDIKARDIEVFDVQHITSLFDRVIIATAESARQTKALANNVREKLKAAGASIQGVEGEETGEWVLVDAGDIVVHIMQPATRQFYNLEELWGQAAPKKRAPRKKSTAAAAAA